MFQDKTIEDSTTLKVLEILGLSLFSESVELGCVESECSLTVVFESVATVCKPVTSELVA